MSPSGVAVLWHSVPSRARPDGLDEMRGRPAVTDPWHDGSAPPVVQGRTLLVAQVRDPTASGRDLDPLVDERRDVPLELVELW